MAGKVSVYGLGSKGVNLVKSPLHLDDNELVQGQNAEFYREQGVAGLRKRAGLVQHTTASLNASPINGGVCLPLPSPTGSGIFVARKPIVPGTITWASHAIPGATTITDIAFAPTLGITGRWCLIGNNYVATSDDSGTTWTAQTPAAANHWNGLCWTGTLFVAVSSDGANRVMTSPDGVTWTARTASEANNWQAVCWAAGLSLLVAVATSGTHRVMTSPDGTTWTNQTAAAALTWAGIAWSPSLGLLCALASNTGSSNVIQTSPDGVTWTQRTTTANLQLSGHTTGGSSMLTWSADAGLFAFPSSLGAATKSVTTSPNGVTWTTQTLPQNTMSNGGVCAVSGGFLIARQDSGGNTVDQSTDGSTWTALTPGVGSSLLDAIAFGVISRTTGIVVVSDQGGSNVVVGTMTLAHADWVESLDFGVSWVATTTLLRPLDATRRLAIRTTAGITVYQGAIPGQILAWDGLREYQVCVLPSQSSLPVASARLLCSNGDQIYAVADDNTTQWAYVVDATTGSVTTIGASLALSGDDMLAGTFYMARLWVVSTNRAGDVTKNSHVYSLRPLAETTWTTEQTAAGTGVGTNKYQFTDLGAFLGALFVSASAGAGVASLIKKRSATGTWSTSLTGPDTDVNDASQFLLFRTIPLLKQSIVAYYDARSGVDHTIKTYYTGDGLTWVAEADLLAQGGTGIPLGASVVTSNVFLTIRGRVFQRSATGTWSVSDTDATIVDGLIVGG